MWHFQQKHSGAIDRSEYLWTAPPLPEVHYLININERYCTVANKLIVYLLISQKKPTPKVSPRITRALRVHTELDIGLNLEPNRKHKGRSKRKKER